MKRISLGQLLEKRLQSSYAKQYEYVRKLIDEGKLVPVKASGLNGKKPALHEAYWVVEEEKDYSELTEELKYKISMQISPDYYLGHLKVYESERKWVMQLSHFLEEQQPQKARQVSLNERSFQIWEREKFLQKEQGKKVLRHCGLTKESLNIYETAEPLACFSSCRKIPQTLLVIENKDTFYSMRRYLLENDADATIFGTSIQTLVYGAGKGILRSMEDFRFSAEPYMDAKENRYLYFGDLDYEGIGIYERMAELFEPYHKITPFVAAYEKMLRKAERCEQLPDTKEGQNQNLSGRFFSYFKADTMQRMMALLKDGKYIPQEILNISDFI